MRVIITFWC